MDEEKDLSRGRKRDEGKMIIEVRVIGEKEGWPMGGFH